MSDWTRCASTGADDSPTTRRRPAWSTADKRRFERLAAESATNTITAKGAAELQALQIKRRRHVYWAVTEL